MKLLFGVVAVSIIVLIIPAILVAHEFDGISDSSPLKYIVDGEIRGVIDIIEAENVNFRSKPQDGMSMALSSVTFCPRYPALAHESLIAYFDRFGYEKHADGTFGKNDREIVIKDIGNGCLSVTKYLPVGD
ncbi:hypothetical protein [Thauera sinica]|uniref:Uncharacterized protein n=1 Tax=Thauera sinica TaxID=2665146 RepID=A0ABW1AT69_9RHOO|nr:hypothetical protein [Thauera sp. K11]